MRKRSPRKRRRKSRSPRKRRRKSRRFSTKGKRKLSKLSRNLYGPTTDIFSELLPVYSKEGKLVGYRYISTIRDQGKQNKLSNLSTFVPLKKQKRKKSRKKK